MSYEFYKILHIFSALMLFTALGTMAVGTNGKTPIRRIAGVAHGVALTLMLVAGFGLLAKLRIFDSLPAWVMVKFGLWFLLALAPIPLRRHPEWRTWIWSLIPVLGGIAAWLAIAKPF